VVDENKACASPCIAGKPLAVCTHRRLHLGQDVPVMRVLPNLNARAGASSHGPCAPTGQQVSQQQLAINAPRCLRRWAAWWRINESAGARCFRRWQAQRRRLCLLFVDALAAAGIRGGLSRNMAQNAAVDMMLGSAMLLKQTGDHPLVLADQVCSPGGTTIEGMHVLKALGFEHAVHEAISAVIKKDRKLAQG
jgi:pyrroline-5-carboxylate reductase